MEILLISVVFLSYTNIHVCNMGIITFDAYTVDMFVLFLNANFDRGQ